MEKSKGKKTWGEKTTGEVREEIKRENGARKC